MFDYGTSGYLQPLPYDGPQITPLKFTKSGSGWNLIYRCQNCTTWPNGGMTLDDFSVLAWVIGKKLQTLGRPLSGR